MRKILRGSAQAIALATFALVAQSGAANAGGYYHGYGYGYGYGYGWPSYYYAAPRIYAAPIYYAPPVYYAPAYYYPPVYYPRAVTFYVPAQPPVYVTRHSWAPVRTVGCGRYRYWDIDYCGRPRYRRAHARLK